MAYVDYDPVVVSHGQALLATAPTVAVINGDLRNPGKILADPGLRKLIDFSEPVAVLLVAILHFIADDEQPYQIADALKAAMPGVILSFRVCRGCDLRRRVVDSVCDATVAA